MVAAFPRCRRTPDDESGSEQDDQAGLGRKPSAGVMFAREAPVNTLFSSEHHNILTFAVSDGLSTISVGSGVREEDGFMTGGRDYASVNEAADRLMTDVVGELRTIKSDVMIESRQA